MAEHKTTFARTEILKVTSGSHHCLQRHVNGLRHRRFLGLRDPVSFLMAFLAPPGSAHTEWNDPSVCGVLTEFAFQSLKGL